MKDLSEGVCHAYVRAFIYYKPLFHIYLFVKLHTFIIIIDMNVYVIRYVPQFYHDLITMRRAIYADTPENEPTQSRTVTMHVVI